MTEIPNIQMNTEFLTQAEAVQITQMLQSPYVIIFAKKTQGGFDTEYIYNGRIKETSQKIQTLRWDRKIQYTLNFEFVSADYN